MADEVYSSNEPPPSPKRRKKRGGRKLRKAQEIDHVFIEETFQFHDASSAVGEGCYISATIQSRRYYGILVDQSSLQAASLMYFKDEASGLDLNRKMESMLSKKQQPQQRMPKQPPKNLIPGLADRPVQKFRFVRPGVEGGATGYRVLLATYCNVAAAAEENDSEDKLRAIQQTCVSGGGFVGEYFYQFEIPCSSLTLDKSKTESTFNDASLRTSMGFHVFLQTTNLPLWFPLSNLQVGQQKVLSMLSMKKDNNGNVIWDDDVIDANYYKPEALIPMRDRPHHRFRVAVVGGGIAGLSCCLELFRVSEQLKRDGIDIDITLLEGRSRLGGRLCTDRTTFPSFPVDLGASWIHGINMNPLANLAREAGAEFVTASEDVKMFQAGMQQVDEEKDEKAGELFDKLLDYAAEECWSTPESLTAASNSQGAVRWYAGNLNKEMEGNKDKYGCMIESSPPDHRRSGDITVDTAVGKAILRHKIHEFASLSEQERSMLMWNLKNIEYALGANVKDLSMKYWDIDERHAFEGDHVLLRQGYATVVDYLRAQLEKRGDRFTCRTDFDVGKISYARRTTTMPYSNGVGRKFVELSDTCLISSRNSPSETIVSDFVVSAVPLGVLKSSVLEENGCGGITFEPKLPFVKQDAIKNVGFGLLNKVFLQFPHRFWQSDDLLSAEQTQFGNASGLNIHHYMFIDVGRHLGLGIDSPAILMSVISGREAVACEKLSKEETVQQIMETLRHIFSEIEVPDPIASTVTKWGSDKFSRGSYTFLTPGCTDQDFEVLQSPINGNGDSILLGGVETMRLFFAGEHTTALHPSMAHGAMLSGIRAAKEVIDAITLTREPEGHYDRLLPLSVFRYNNPKRPLRCCMCQRGGPSSREGSLLAFKRGSRQILCHSNCAEYSPEVEVFEGKWKDLFVAVNRSKNIICTLCRKSGASIGCGHEFCDRCYHFSCAEDTGWRFDEDGKAFRCDRHRSIEVDGSRRISLQHFKNIRPGEPAVCCLCSQPGKEHTLGELLAFLRLSTDATKNTAVVVHELCLKHTTVVDPGEVSMSRIEKDYRNVLTVQAASRSCSLCGKGGATSQCAKAGCNTILHLPCAQSLGWNHTKSSPFVCKNHRAREATGPIEPRRPTKIQHALFSHLLDNQFENTDNEATPSPELEKQNEQLDPDSYESESEESEIVEAQLGTMPLLTDMVPLAAEKSSSGILRYVHLSRTCLEEKWNFELFATCDSDATAAGSASRKLSIASTTADMLDQLAEGDTVVSVNGVQVGGKELKTLKDVLRYLKRSLDLVLEIRRTNPLQNDW